MRRITLNLPVLLLGLLLLISREAVGQNNAHTQDVRGTVRDQFTGELLPGAKVIVTQDMFTLGGVTDANGRFRLENVPTGRINLQVTLAGYEKLLLPDLVLNQGKQLVLDLDLLPMVSALEQVSIHVDALEPISSRSISVEETKRFAAVYFDPARVATALPGVVQADDQSNNLIVRGNSPNGVLWRLEGVDILNPNHLTNAGTLGDRATAGGGGTSILSSQLLGRSTFSSSNFATDFGNALSGVFDIRLRPGNDEKFELTAQTGLIGIDLAAEGPISKRSKSSFLINYRYSTVGLLALMGVPLGDEDIRYQDLSFNLKLPTKRWGEFTIFGLGGLSSNKFSGAQQDSLTFPNPTVTWKDYFDISFRSDMGAVGFSHRIRLGERAQLQSAGAFSAQATSRRNVFLPVQSTREVDSLTQSRATVNTTLRYRISEKFNLKTGLFLSRLTNAIGAYRFFGNGGLIAGGNSVDLLIQPFAELRWDLLPKLMVKGGLHGMRYGDFGAQALEPRFRLSWKLGTRQAVHAGVGWHSQLQLPGTYFALERVGMTGTYNNVNRGLDFTRARHYVLNFDQYFSDVFRLRLEGYYQDLYDVPIVADPNRSFSALNLVEGYVSEKLVNAGSGRNYGVEVNLERLLNRNYYFLLSGALYRSLYIAGNGIEYPSRFDGRFSTAAAAGYEWDRESRKGRQQIFGLNLRAVFRGGMREMPVDIDASRQQFTTVYDESNGFSEQLPNYFRLDFRFTFKRNRPGYTNTLGVDIQNVLNTRNAAYTVFDPSYSRTFLRYQLGIIPLLSYRMEF